jgi:hypothetical protein
MPSSSPHPISRRQLLFATGVTGAAAAAGLLRPERALATSGPQSYSASWSSVDQHPPAPQWFMDAKFGIYFHWGVFSVPAFSNEWYPRNMYNTGSVENQHHIATYGDPSVWPHHNFTGISRADAGLIQRIGLAVSDDLMTWRKHPGNPVIEADGRWYELLDLTSWRDQSWRDPWLFRGRRDGAFHALITARRRPVPLTAGEWWHTPDPLTSCAGKCCRQ